MLFSNINFSRDEIFRLGQFKNVSLDENGYAIVPLTCGSKFRVCGPSYDEYVMTTDNTIDICGVEFIGVIRVVNEFDEADRIIGTRTYQHYLYAQAIIFSNNLKRTKSYQPWGIALVGHDSCYIDIHSDMDRVKEILTCIAHHSRPWINQAWENAEKNIIADNIVIKLNDRKGISF